MAMCANHPDTVAVAYCRECGKPLCGICRIEDSGAIYCADHSPAILAAKAYSAPTATAEPQSTWDWSTQPGASYAGSSYAGSSYAGTYPTAAPDPMGATPPPPAYAASPYAAPPARRRGPYPALAVILGTIPGVGAIYNGQYAKGLIHAVIFGLLITIVSHNENGPLTPLVGILIAVWWFYMVIEAFHTAHKRYHGVPVDEFSSLLNLRHKSGLPLGALVLICLGGLLLLDTSGLIPIDRLLRYWPIGLILAGVYLLYVRSERGHAARPAQSLPQEFIDERR